MPRRPARDTTPRTAPVCRGIVAGGMALAAASLIAMTAAQAQTAPVGQAAPDPAPAPDAASIPSAFQGVPSITRPDPGPGVPPPGPAPDAPVRGLARAAPGDAPPPSSADAPPAAAPVSPAPPGLAPLGGDTSAYAPPDRPVGPEPVQLDHPRVIDTGRLAVGAGAVSLFGVVGLDGAAAEDLQTYLASTDDHVTCMAHAGNEFVCLLSDGTDLAEVGLLNGAARTKDDAPDSYREQEAAAQAARRGIWSDLPPPPAVLTHPVVTDTATLVVDGQTYPLDGLQGLGAPYAGQLQGYIASHGDTLSCQPQPGSGKFVCLLNDNTDIATVALVNGAALVASDAPDTYRLQQRDALLNQRGYWLHPAPDVVVAATTIVEAPTCCVFVAGDQGSDGVTYVGGVPAAVIDNETVFLVFAGAAGWGYYDHVHHWHGAPDRYRAHMERFHPEGHGLRGYGEGHYGGGYASSYGRGPGGAPAGGARVAGLASAPGHAGVPVYGGVPARPAMAASPGYGGAAAHGATGFQGHAAGPAYAAAPGRPAAAAPGAAGMAGYQGHPGMQGRPGMAPAPAFAAGRQPAAMGGGFVRPNAAAAGFHPGAMPHAAAMPAAAPRPAAAAVAVKHH